MQAAEPLTVMAEVFVAFAGFSGIVAALRRRNPGEWSDLDGFRLRFMVEFSLAAFGLSVLPFFFSELGLSDARVWSFASLVLGAGALFYLLRFALRLDRLVVVGEPVSRGLALVSVVVAIGVAGFAFANATGYFSRPAGVYVAGVGGCLFVAAAMFARLLLTSASE